MGPWTNSPYIGLLNIKTLELLAIMFFTCNDEKPYLKCIMTGLSTLLGTLLENMRHFVSFANLKNK
jgi:hypothetical protein